MATYKKGVSSNNSQIVWGRALSKTSELKRNVLLGLSISNIPTMTLATKRPSTSHINTDLFNFITHVFPNVSNCFFIGTGVNFFFNC